MAGRRAELNAPLLRKMVDHVIELERAKDEMFVSTIRGKLTWRDHVWHQGSWMIFKDEEGNQPDIVEITDQGAVGKLSRMRCGTAACLAGETFLQHAAVGSTYKIEPDLVKEPGMARAEHVSNWAQKKLGLTYEQREELFRGDNKASDLRRISERIIMEAEIKAARR